MRFYEIRQDREDYVEKMMDVTKAAKFKTVTRSPIPQMKVGLATVLKDIEKCFGAQTKWKLMVSNPCVPKLYGMPKTHKPILKMRPIVSNIRAPTEKVVKWLVKEFRNYKQPEGRSVKNVFEFVEKTKNMTIAPDELIVSFDVEALFPSIPIKETLKMLRENTKPIKRNVEPCSEQRSTVWITISANSTRNFSKSPKERVWATHYLRSWQTCSCQISNVV